MEKESSQEGLLSKDESFHQILDAIADMILVKGEKSRILWANKAFCNYYGMTNEQLKGIIDSPFSEPDHTQQYVKDDAHVFNSGKVLDIPQEPVTRFDGVSRIFHTVKSPIFSEAGNVLMTVGISRDITEKINNQKQIEEERAKALYSAKMATLGEMAGGIAHEINTPLAIISMLAAQLQEVVSEGKFEKENILKSIVKIEKTAHRIAKIIVGLRAFSRIDTDDRFQQLKARELIQETLSFCNERFVQQNIKVEYIDSTGDVTFECKPIQLSQVILNLLSNASDAISDIPKKWIRVESRDLGDMVEISVTDCGKGIPLEVQQKIFMPFYTTKELGKGTGLGLSISKGIVEDLSGTIEVDNSSENTRFLIKLPKVQPK